MLPWGMSHFYYTLQMKKSRLVEAKKPTRYYVVSDRPGIQSRLVRRQNWAPYGYVGLSPQASQEVAS